MLRMPSDHRLPLQLRRLAVKQNIDRFLQFRMAAVRGDQFTFMGGELQKLCVIVPVSERGQDVWNVINLAQSQKNVCTRLRLTRFP